MCASQEKSVWLMKLPSQLPSFALLESSGCERQINAKRLVSEIRSTEKQSSLLTYLLVCGGGEGDGR